MRYSLVIFDLDGTILDTLEDLTDSTNYALSQNYLPVRTSNEVKQFVGNGIHNLIERAVPQGSEDNVTERVFRDFNEYYKDHCFDKTKPYEGMLQCIDTLKNAGIRIAVVSNKADYAVQELCRKFFFGLSDISVGEREGVRRKPCPDSVEYVMDVLGIDKKESVYIGDSEVDIQTAKNADIDEIAVSWGFREKDFLKSHGAEIIAQTPDELCKILMRESR